MLMVLDTQSIKESTKQLCSIKKKKKTGLTQAKNKKKTKSASEPPWKRTSPPNHP
jgi:hypothetical protein